MTRWLCPIIIGILCCLPPSAFGADHVRIMVLPFEIQSAQKDLEYLKDQIPQLIQQHLERDGAAIVKLDDATQKSLQNAASTEALKSLGAGKGADEVIHGSLTWLGQNFSLDVRMVDVVGSKVPDAFYADGEGIENLPAAVKSLSNAISAKLFKLEKIVDVRIVGNKRIEQDAIRRVIKSQAGDTLIAKNISDDLKAIYGMGYFDDVRVESEDVKGGKTIIFVVKEKPTIRHIFIKGQELYQGNTDNKKEPDPREKDSGNLIIENDKILKSLDIKTGSILNIYKIQSNVKRIEDLYKEKNYHNVKVTYNIKELDNNQADLQFNIDEGKKSLVKEIRFEGNQAYSAKQLKKIMKTTEKGFWSWLTSSGDMKTQDLKQDEELLTDFYHNNGYIDAKVGEPIVEYKGNWIYITVKIDEGSRFKVGKIEIVGDLLKPEPELMKLVKLNQQKFFSREVLRNDIIALGDEYSDAGYAYADIVPKIDADRKNLTVNVTYTIAKNSLVYVEAINITGNIKTRDKVIRRELEIYEQELFSGKKLKQGIRNLQRLDYFEDVKVNTVKGSTPDEMVLNIGIKEKPTGTFSVGGGYSSIENMFAVGAISQRNLFGRGEQLMLKAEIGGTTTRYNLTFVEPWLFDIPLSLSSNVYDQSVNYNTYSVNSFGGGLSFGYPIFRYTRAYMSYAYDVSDMTDLASYVSDYFRTMAGQHTTSSVTPAIRYDSRDKTFNPTEGSNDSVSVEYAGGPLGGDVGYTKYQLELGKYFPLFWTTVGFLHAKTGYIQEHSGELLPPYDRFYIGGINSLRGFTWDQLSPKDSAGDDIGGDKFVQFNVEYIFPLLKDIGLMGVVFYDTGNLYDNNQNIDLSNLRKSAGFGIRWYSPLGPLRIEDGFILDPKPGESTGGRWEFTMGQSF